MQVTHHHHCHRFPISTKVFPISAEIRPQSSPQTDQIDLTGEDDDDGGGCELAYTDTSAGSPVLIVTTAPGQQPDDSGCNFNIVDVSSLSHTDMPTLVPSFLVDNSGSLRASYSHDNSGSVQASYSQRASTPDDDSYDPNSSYQHAPDAYTETDASTSSMWIHPSTSGTQHDPGSPDYTEYETVISESYCDPNQPMPKSIPINPFKAVKFNKEFYGRSKTRILLKKHICEICGKRMLKKSDLERHYRVHTGDRPFRCPACNRYFSQKHNLYLHRRQHQH